MTTQSSVSSEAVLAHIDATPKTAQQITVALFGPQQDGVKWWLVSTRLDWLAAQGRIETRKRYRVS